MTSCSVETEKEFKLKHPNKESNVANPDPWVRLIGPLQEAEVYLNGQATKCLLDGGAQVSTIGEGFCKEHGYDIHPISSRIELLHAGGGGLEYKGFVEEHLHVPGKAFSRYIPILVVEDSQLRSSLPLHLGTLTLNSIMEDIEAHNEHHDLPPSWQAAYNQVLYLRRCKSMPYKPLGYVKSTKKYTVLPGESIGVHGLTRIPTYGMVVNVITESSSKVSVPKGLQVQSTYTNLLPGSKRALVMLTNVSNKPIKVKPGSTLAEVGMANKIPKLLSSSEEMLKEAKEWEDLCEEMGVDDEVRQILIKNELAAGKNEGVKVHDSGYVSGMNVSESELAADQILSASVTSNPVGTAVGTMEGKGTSGGGSKSEPDNGDWLMEKLDLSGLETWPEHLQHQARALLKNHASLFAKHDLDMGRTSLVKHKIVLTDPVPFKEKYRRIPPQLYEEVRAHLKEMLDLGAITHSNSPWSSPIVLVRKKDGRLRFCIDLRKLNLRTVKDSYSLPRIESVLEHLVGACIFSTLDLKAGYWQVELDEDSKPFTAFTCGPLGFFQCDTMPFGACNAPATFQRLMENCLGDLNLSWCLVYLDDIIIFSSTPEEHLERLEAVFQKLEAAGLKLKPSKCNFFREEIQYLGHIVSKEGIKADPKKVEAVVNWSPPTTVSEVRRFLGFVGFYRRFIKGFSRIAKPLTDLTRGLESSSKRIAKKTPVEWGKPEQKGFQSLKDKLVSAPVLAYADYTKPFILHTDSSTEGLGAVLYQMQEGEKRVIAYASRGLSRSEVNYPAHKLEFLALKWSVTEKFHEYLYGGLTFDVYTDNNPLTYVLSTAKLDACGHRWVAALANYNFNLHYKPGPSNIDADALSRMGWPSALSTSRDDGLRTMDKECVLAACVGMLESPVYIESLAVSGNSVPPEALEPFQPGLGKEQWKSLQRDDPVLSTLIEGLENKTLGKRALSGTDSKSLKYYLRHKDQLLLRDDILYRKTLSDNTKTRASHLQLLLPSVLVPQVLKGYHDQVGHLGRDKSLGLIRERFWWDTLHKDVVGHVSSCPVCLRRKSMGQKAPLEPISATQPLELVHMDFLKLEPCKGKIENVLVITDHFTRYAQAYPSKTQTAYATAKLLWENFITHYGFPSKFISDQGANFEAQLIQHLCQIAGVEKVRTTPYHPQTNGQAERFNHTLCNMLGTMPEGAKADWKLHLSSMTHAYNSATNASTGYSPFYLMYGRHPRLPMDVELGVHRGGVGSSSTNQYAHRLQKRLQYAHSRAAALAKKEALRHKKLYDSKCRAATLAPGDLVLVKQLAFRGRHKLENRWENEEYTVVEQPDTGVPVYRLKNQSGKERVLHRNHLLPILSRNDDSGVESADDLDLLAESTDSAMASIPQGDGGCAKSQPEKTLNKSDPALEEDEGIPDGDGVSESDSTDSDSDLEGGLLELPSVTPRSKQILTEDQGSGIPDPLETVDQSAEAPKSLGNTKEMVAPTLSPSAEAEVAPNVTLLGTSGTSVVSPARSVGAKAAPTAELEADKTPSVGSSTPGSPSGPRRSSRSTKGKPPVRFGQAQIQALLVPLNKLKAELEQLDQTEEQWV